MFFAGVDVGSVAAKALILQDREIIASAIEPTGWSPRGAGRSVFEKAAERAGIQPADLKRVIGTGYGRVSLDFIDQAVTEITCHAKGANYWFPDPALVIDIGGQDSKAIAVDGKGKVLNFVMNDKCAAGTGRFLQLTMHTLGLELDQLDQLMLVEPVAINSMCTVFAESEVVSLLAAGVPKEKIAAGLYHSIARRISAMIGSFGPFSQVIFTGGLANNKGMQTTLSKVLGASIAVPENPQMIGALGAALIGEGMAHHQ
ncbi:acyl-CoA dehydratase activase [Candidatus Formimonas warabiya]|uniref:2-hydroxyglutaryl-CoA dehydratase n=1 Tax=Formimonas warabiya TaxID=1761012 RepID=A0A3G1KYF6_FORW1|nr:acyl-CoA dehydratase activase [Candidatus Formimonas warabiya]ATW27482.1 2-hydroxyglutaryl-CoA dehydratase [Candidatus Formimonas warabiya]